MSDAAPSNPTPPPPPGWVEAMQGKSGNAKRVQAGKRAFVILFLTFFGTFLWLYILYNISHSKKATASERGAVPISAMPHESVPAGMPAGAGIHPTSSGTPMGAGIPTAAGMPMAAGIPSGVAPSFMTGGAPAHFGMPRGMTAETGPSDTSPSALAPQAALSLLPAIAPMAAPQVNPYAPASTAGSYAHPGYGVPSYGAQPAYANPYMPAAQTMPAAHRGEFVITAPREYRHAIGVPGGGPNQPGIPTQRHRTVVTR